MYELQITMQNNKVKFKFMTHAPRISGRLPLKPLNWGKMIIFCAKMEKVCAKGAKTRLSATPKGSLFQPEPDTHHDKGSLMK